MNIYAVGAYGQNILDDSDANSLPDLNGEVKASTTKSFRRINRFTQLALIGSHRCASKVTIQSKTGLYLVSGQVSTDDIAKMQVTIFRDKQFPMPLSFVNTLGNTACFYIAKSLGLESINMCTTNYNFPFESLLTLVSLDFKRNQIKSALVGAVDECMHPLANHRRRLWLKDDLMLAEGSHWFYLSEDICDTAPIGKIHRVIEAVGFNDLVTKLRMKLTTIDNPILSNGFNFCENTLLRLQETLDIKETYHYRDGVGYFNTLTAKGIADFLQQNDSRLFGRTLLHINSSYWKLNTNGDASFRVLIVQRISQ